jgi:hypothetical protein
MLECVKSGKVGASSLRHRWVSTPTTSWDQVKGRADPSPLQPAPTLSHLPPSSHTFTHPPADRPTDLIGHEHHHHHYPPPLSPSACQGGRVRGCEAEAEAVRRVAAHAPSPLHPPRPVATKRGTAARAAGVRKGKNDDQFTATATTACI